MILRRALAGALSLLAVTSAPAAAQFTPGAAGGGDPFFPSAGNGGYDVQSYAVKLDYDAQNEQLAGDVTIAARATQDLSSFNLDLLGFNVSTVTVNGAAATFARKDQELTVRPASGLARNTDFTARIVYAGHVNNVRDPDHARDGWIPTEDGAYVANEPQGVPSWLPVNDSLKDFATWDFQVTVPQGRTVMANGVLVSKTDSGGKTTWHWRETSPMVSYLATATNGVFELRTSTLANGLPRYDAVDPQTRYYGEKTPRPQDAWDTLAIEPEAVDFLSNLYGPYPFEAVGGVVDWAPNVFFALETQTKPLYDVLPDELTVVHELAHQWFGDALVLDHWSDMWLNEGFATWSEWIWTERHGGQTAQQRFNQLYARSEDSRSGQDLWFPAPDALPGPADLFGTPVYDRGAMTLQALRAKIGNDNKFIRILRTWYAENRYSNVTTDEFIATAESVSGMQLDHFFDVWLFQAGRPEPGSW
ncbi:MAG TPA: M1 family metallopeptidase [Thermoleophilaceae bacterium]